MPFCGFNQKMLDGLKAFTEGLVEHGLEFRSEQNGETIEQAIKREISDMARLLFETQRIDDSAKRVLTEGLVQYALGFYLLVRAKGIESSQELIANVLDYFKSMDEKYYSELEGKPDDMRILAEHLNKIEI